MPFGEEFTLLAVLKATDEMSKVLEKVDGSLNHFQQDVIKTASVAVESGAKIDEGLLQTASGADALELAAARTATAQDKLAAATRAQAEAEAALLQAREVVATEDELAAAADAVSAAQQKATAAATELKDARTALKAATKAKASEDELAQATAAVTAAEEKATLATRELTDARAQQAALVTPQDVEKAADALTAAERRATTATREATTAQERQAEVERAAAAASTQAAAETDTAAAAQTRLRGATDEVAAGSGMASKALGFGALAVAAVGYESVKAAMSYQTLTTRLVTTAGESQKNLKLIQQGMLAISQTTGATANDLAKSMYTVEAAGYRGADGLKVLQAATEGARLEGSDFGTVSNAVTDILKDYHLGADQAANVTSQLVAAVGSGKANFQQMSASMANILPMAAAVHLKFSDVSGVLAEMTSHGVTAQRASQNMANALRSLEAPSGTMLKEFKQVGISAKDVQNNLATKGLGGTLQWLSGVAQANAKHLGQTYPGALRALMGTAAGLNVALMTTGENSKDVKTAISNIAKASADAKGNVSGFSSIQQTLSFKLDQAKNAVHNVGIALGTMLLPAVTKVAGAVASVLGPMASWIEHNQKVIKLIAAIVGPAVAVIGVIKTISLVTKAWGAAQEILDAAMTDNPIGLLVTVLAAVVGGLIYAYTHFKTFRDVVNEVGHFVATVFVGLWHALETAFHAIVHAAESAWHGLESAWNAVVGAAKTVWNFLAGIWNAIANVTTSVWNGIKGFFEKWWPLLLVIFAAPIAVIMAIWNHFHTAIEDTAKTVWNAVKGFFVGVWDFLKTAAAEAFNLIYEYVVSPMERAWHMLVSVWNAINQAINSAVHWVMGYIAQAWGLIYQYIVAPLEQAFGFVSRIFSQIVSTIRSAINGVLNWLSGIGSWFVNIGSDIVNGIISGIESAGSSLFSTLGNLAKSALSAAKSFLGIGSPSKLFRDEIGRWIPEGIAAGVQQHAAVAQKAVATMAAALPASVSTSVTSSFAGVGAGLPALAGAGGSAGGGTVINLDIHGNYLMNDSDADRFAQRIGKRIATTIGPSAGLKFNGGML